MQRRSGVAARLRLGRSVGCTCVCMCNVAACPSSKSSCTMHCYHAHTPHAPCTVLHASKHTTCTMHCSDASTESPHAPCTVLMQAKTTAQCVVLHASKSTTCVPWCRFPCVSRCGPSHPRLPGSLSGGGSGARPVVRQAAVAAVALAAAAAARLRTSIGEQQEQGGLARLGACVVCGVAAVCCTAGGCWRRGFVACGWLFAAERGVGAAVLCGFRVGLLTVKCDGAGQIALWLTEWQLP